MSIKSKSLYDKICRNKPYFEDFVTRSVYHSNAIEGSTLSYAETYALLFNDNSMKVNASLRELYEAINLKYALNHILTTLEEPLTPEYARQIGIYINRNINEIDNFRSTPVFIRGAEHIPPESSQVPGLLSELFYSYEHSGNEDLFEKVAEMHIRFERVHPFIDGNGRAGRLLIAKELLKEGMAPVVIPVDNRAEYMKLLAGQNVSGLARFLERLSGWERRRMEDFGISLKGAEKEMKR